METTKLSSKGHAQAYTDSAQMAAGSRVLVEDMPNGVLLRPLKPFKPTRLEDVIGCAAYTGPAKTIEDMDEAIAVGIKATYDRD